MGESVIGSFKPKRPNHGVGDHEILRFWQSVSESIPDGRVIFIAHAAGRSGISPKGKRWARRAAHR